MGALVVPASTHENRASEPMLDHLERQGVTGRLGLVLVDRGVSAVATRTLGRHHDLEVRRVGWDDKQPVFRPIRHAWRVEVAHGRLGRPRRLAKSFENTTTSATGWLQVACIATTLHHLSQETAPPRQRAGHGVSDRQSRAARNAAVAGAYPPLMAGRAVIDRSPWRWALVAIGLLFVGLELPTLFQPVPDYARHDNFELFMFYAIPAVITVAGFGLTFVALRSGVLADSRGLLIRPVAGVRSKRVAVESIRAVTVIPVEGPGPSCISPALIQMDDEVVDLGLADYDTPRGRRRIRAKALKMSKALSRPLEGDD